MSEKLLHELQIANADLRAQLEQAKRLDSEAAQYVEMLIIERCKFSGEPPYVGWKGLGLALREHLDKTKAAAQLGYDLLDAAKEEVAEGGWSEEADLVLEAAERLGVGNVRRVPYDPTKHELMDCEPGDLIWYWGKEK